MTSPEPDTSYLCLETDTSVDCAKSGYVPGPGTEPYTEARAERGATAESRS
jgi:hypothetical protein